MRPFSDLAIRLVRATDAHFQWMLTNDRPVVFEGLSLPEGGVDTEEILSVLRAACAEHADSDWGTYIIVAGSEAAGLCSYKRPPDESGTVEIGYGVAPAWRRRGIATRGLALLIARSTTDPRIKEIIAETAAGNIASIRTLMRLGFVQACERFDEEGGVLLVWAFSHERRSNAP